MAAVIRPTWTLSTPRSNQVYFLSITGTNEDRAPFTRRAVTVCLTTDDQCRQEHHPRTRCKQGIVSRSDHTV